LIDQLEVGASRQSKYRRESVFGTGNLGVVETQPGRGCFLKANNAALRKVVRRRLLIAEIDQALVQAHHLQVSRKELLELIHERMAALEEKRRANEDDKEA